MTYRQLVSHLASHGIEDAKFEASVLIEHFCAVERSKIPFMTDADLSCGELEEALSRREAGEPLQYIVGKWYFMNEVYEVTPSVLIPRQDTETLVEWAISNVPRGGKTADVGTGSGCIAISVTAARADITCVALDKYPDALEVAKRNAFANGVEDRVRFVRTDVLTDTFPKETFDCILSNPPYVSNEEYLHLDRELYFEPRCALTDGADGLTFYRRILEICPASLTSCGVIALEIGSSQGESVRKIAESFGLSCEILRDLSGRERVALCKKHAGSIS